MQDMRIFNNSGGIDRRLRSNGGAISQQQQALKCPRCDSLNTKFCYYNNYNLAQPRFYCKGCRRYWTKGGVLRNVPVGGGIRKAKRSSSNKSKKKNNNCNSISAAATKSADSNSSSERSSLTAAEVVSQMNSCPPNQLLGFASQFPEAPPNSSCFNHQNFIDPDSAGSMMFTDMAGHFTEIMAASSTGLLGFNIADTSTTFRSDNQHNDDQVQNIKLYSQEATPQIDDSKEADIKMISSNNGLSGVEWHVDDDQGIYGLTGNVDEAYWSQNQWPDHHTDHSFHFHLP